MFLRQEGPQLTFQRKATVVALTAGRETISRRSRGAFFWRSPTPCREIAAAALWGVAGFYDLPSVDETTAIRASNLHVGERSADAPPFRPNQRDTCHRVKGTSRCSILGAWPNLELLG